MNDQLKKYQSPYYNPLKNYGEGIPSSSAVSGPVRRYLDQQQPPTRQPQQQAPPQSREYQDSLEPYVPQSKPGQSPGPRPTMAAKGNSYKQNVEQFFRGHTPTQQSVDRYQDTINAIDPRTKAHGRDPHLGHPTHDPHDHHDHHAHHDHRGHQHYGQPEQHYGYPSHQEIGDDQFQRNKAVFFSDQMVDRDSAKKHNIIKNAIQRSAKPQSRSRPVLPSSRDPAFFKNLKNFYGDDNVPASPYSRQKEISPTPPSPALSRQAQPQPQAPPKTPMYQPSQQAPRSSQLRGPPITGKPIVLLPLGFPLKMMSSHVSDNFLISMPNQLNSDQLVGLLGMYGVSAEGSEIWLMLRGEEREKSIISKLRDLGGKVRGLGIMGGKLEFIF